MTKVLTKRKAPNVQTRRAKIRREPSAAPYHEVTRRPLQCLVFLLPMLLAYEVGMILAHPDASPMDRPDLAARQLLFWFFSLFGVTGYYLPGFVLAVVLFCWHIATDHPWRVQWNAMGGMALESFLLALPLMLLNTWIPTLRGQTGDSVSTVDNILLSVGAGIYEELVFRLIAITLLLMLIHDIARWREATAVFLAVILSSALFAAHHYEPIGADHWSWNSFAFRWMAGGYLAAIFVARGFGVAVGCHVVYDVLAVIQ